MGDQPVHRQAAVVAEVIAQFRIQVVAPAVDSMMACRLSRLAKAP